jgi:hypothetical protein
MTSRRSSSKLVLAAFSAGLALTLNATFSAGLTHADTIIVCFSPRLDGGCDPTQTIVARIDGAQRQILVQAYEFTSAPIAKAVVEAKGRGVEVRVILDKQAAGGGYSAATFLKHAGVPVLIDREHKIAHNKVIVIDGRTVITGSFNFTKAAEEHNAENLVVIDDPAIAAQYVRNWQVHAAHSTAPSSPRGPEPREGPLSNAPDCGGPIVGNRRSRIYAWPGCASYDTMAPENRVVFPSAEAAEAAGYRAARNCKPCSQQEPPFKYY